LDQKDFVAFFELQIDSAVGTTTTGFGNGIALQPKRFTNQQFKIAPRHATQCFTWLAAGNVINQPSTLASA
jgi:hypothetical protein